MLWWYDGNSCGVSALCMCDRMASKICDSEARRTSKIIHTVPKPYFASSPADFASLYTAKSGTPLLYRQDITPYRDSNVLAVCTPSPLVHCDMIWPCDSSFGDVTSFSDDPSQSVFCNRFNVQSCLRYLNQVCLNLTVVWLLIVHLWYSKTSLSRPSLSRQTRRSPRER